MFGDAQFLQSSLRKHREEISSVERVIENTNGEVNEVSPTPGCERVRVQIDSGAIDTVGPKEIAKACEMKETEISNRDVGYIAANGSSIKKYGEKVVGYTDGGESVSMMVQRADVIKVL